ncbi:MAG: serine/threonine-protein kinase, partial [Planctomycetota bacterium]
MGGIDAFDLWASQQPSLMADEELMMEVRAAFEASRNSPHLNRVLSAKAPSRSFFGLRDGTAHRASGSSTDTRLTPGQRIGRFALRSFLARGGMGEVWIAEDLDLRREVALKFVLPDRMDERSLKLFAREARAGGRLSHPNLVTTLSYGVDDGLSWIAQELVTGSWTVKDSLSALRSEDSVPKDYYRKVAELVMRVADGMQAAHDAGVIHRDIKPQNILISDDDTPKITDFGLARVTDDSVFSQSGDLAGTWAYMSPEQVTASRMGLDHRTDVFSLGVVLYELLTLRRPFEGDTTHQIATRILTEEPAPIAKIRSQCPRELTLICAKAMEKAPARRYSTMGAFRDDLSRHLAHEPITARPASRLVRLQKWSRRNPSMATGLSVSIVASLVLAFAATSNFQLAQERSKEAARAIRLEGDVRRAR